MPLRQASLSRTGVDQEAVAPRDVEQFLTEQDALVSVSSRRCR